MPICSTPLLDRMFITKGPDENYISYYTIASSIVMLIASVLSGAINVSIPRLGYYLGKKDYESYKKSSKPRSRPLLFPYHSNQYWDYGIRELRCSHLFF